MSKPLGGFIKLLVFVAVFCSVYFLFIHEDRVALPPGIQAFDEPVQVDIDPVVVYEDDTYQVTGVAEFSLRAKVLARKRYSSDTESALSPIDLALGWQRMSDQRVVDEIRFSQRGRWYHWRTNNSPIPLREVEQCSANMHMLPKNDAVEKALLAVRTGEIVELSGYLVDVRGSNWSWNSSRTRDDTGDGACEIIWVEAFEVVQTDS